MTVFDSSSSWIYVIPYHITSIMYIYNVIRKGMHLRDDIKSFGKTAIFDYLKTGPLTPSPLPPPPLFLIAIFPGRGHHNA